MVDQTLRSSKLSPNQQVANAIKLVDKIRDLLQRRQETLPADVHDNLIQLSSQLTKLGRQVASHDSRRDNMLALTDISQIINSSLDLNEVLRIVMDTIIRLTRAERGFLMLKDEHGEWVIRVARNWERESIDPSELTISRTVVNRVIAESQPVLTTNAQEDPRFGGHDSIVAYNLRSILCVPLKGKDDELIGIIYADNRIRAGIFTETERDLLAAFANQAAVALENARLFESVHRTLAEVTELKNLMDNVFASIASGVITTDISSRITLCNQAAEAILGCKNGELVGNTLGAVLPAIAPVLNKHIDTVWNTDQSVVGLEYYGNLPGRGPLSLSLNLSPLKDADHITQGVAIVLDDLTEKKRLEAQRRLFERMVSPAVIEQLDPDQLQLGGRREEITILFADIRGFTSFSERIAPEQLVSVLNCYLATAAEAVLEHEGTIDKFFGDAVMAWFNAPIPQPDHTLRAIRAALRLQDTICHIQSEMPAEFRLSFGVGIHTGDAILGLIGTETRLDYTAIGDSVNTARRIQENASEGQILISAEAYEQVSAQVVARPVKAILAKGKSQPIKVYEISGLKR